MNKGVYSQPTVSSRVVRIVWVMYIADILVGLALPCTIGLGLQLSIFKGTGLNPDPVSVDGYNGSMLESNVMKLLISKVPDNEASLTDTTYMWTWGHLSKSDISLDQHVLQSRLQCSTTSNSLWLIKEQSGFTKTISTASDRLNVFFVLILNFQAHFCSICRSILLSVLLLYWVSRSSTLQLLQVINFYRYIVSVLKSTLLHFQVHICSICRNLLLSVLQILQLQLQAIYVQILEFILLIIQISKMFSLFFWLQVQFLNIWQSVDHTRCISNICARFNHHDECWGFTPAGEQLRMYMNNQTPDHLQSTVARCVCSVLIVQ